MSITEKECQNMENSIDGFEGIYHMKTFIGESFKSYMTENYSFRLCNTNVARWPDTGVRLSFDEKIV